MNKTSKHNKEMNCFKKIIVLDVILVVLSSSVSALDIFLDSKFINNPDFSNNTFGTLKEGLDFVTNSYSNETDINLLIQNDLQENIELSFILTNNYTLTAINSTFWPIIQQNTTIDFQIDGHFTIKNVTFNGNHNGNIIFFNISQNGTLILKNWAIWNYDLNVALLSLIQGLYTANLFINNGTFVNTSIKNNNYSPIPFLIQIQNSQTVTLEALTISNFSLENVGFFNSFNVSSTNISNFLIEKSYLAINETDSSMGILFDISGGQTITINNISILNNNTYCGPPVFRYSNSDPSNNQVFLYINALMIDNSTKEMTPPFIYVEFISIFELSNSTFNSIVASSQLILSSVDSILLENIKFSNFNSDNKEASTIVSILNFKLASLEGFSCINSSSYNSATCVMFSNSLATSCSLNIKNSLFFQNTATFTQSSSIQGAAIYISLTQATIIFSNVTIEKNQVKGFSSAPCIYSDSVDDSMKITNCYFIGNTADFLEICMLHRGSLLLIEESEFSHNFNPNFDASSNAAATIASYYVYLTNVTFWNNQATNGAAILLINSLNKPLTFAAIDNITVASNTATYSPILFSSNIQVFEITINNSNFMSNNGLIKGGVFQTWYALYGNNLTFQNCMFFNNTAISAGGVAYIANLGNNLFFINCSFISNQALKDGGGAFNMYGDPNTIVSSQDCRFINNTARVKGGVFLITTGVYYDTNSVFQDNQASEGGAIAINFFSIMVLMNSIVKNCSATSTAGMLKMMGQADASLVNVQISNCFAPKGGVFVTGGVSVLQVLNCTFIENKAINATLMYATNTAYAISIINSLFIGTKGSRNGFELSSCEIIFTNCQFISNEINLIYMELSTVTVNGILIQDHHCSIGQIACMMNILSKSQVNLTDFVFKNVSSDELQGNIVLDISTLNLENGVVLGISIASLGDLVSASQSTLNFTNISLSQFLTVAIYLEQSTFTLMNSQIVQDEATNKHGIGAVSCLYCVNILIYNTKFENISNLNEYSGAITIQGILSASFAFNISNCSFTGNLGILGGGISINNSNISLISNIFNNNSAEFGAGVYLYCDINIICYWDVSSNVFIKNKASVSGGAIRWEPYVPITNSPNTFTDNVAFFGNDLASQPLRLSLKQEDLIQFRAFPSGNSFKPFSIYLLDYYGQIVKGLDGLALIKLEYVNSTQYANSIIGLLGSQVVLFENNSFTFQELVIIGSPQSELYLTISSALIPYYYSFLLNQNENDTDTQYYYEVEDPNTQEYEMKILINMRMCQLGEVYNLVENTCDLCPYGQYSLNPNATSCQECPENTICMGGYNISVNPGFWRSNNMSTNIYSCLISGVCLGGFDSQCQQGYTGPLCDVCVLDGNTQYYKFGGSKCDSCSDENPLGFVLFALFYVFMILYVMFTIKKNIDSVNTTETLNYEIPVFLKIGMDYVQIISAISLLNVHWPTNFSSVLNTSGSTGNLNSIMFPFECLLAKLPINTNVFYLKIFMGSIFAWFNFLFSGLVWVVYMKVQKKTLDYFKKEILITIIVVGFTLQPSIVNMYFTAINCIDIDGVSYVKKQLTLRCWEGEHLEIFFYFVLPSLLLWSIILPLICFIYVRNNIHSKDYQSRASLIYVTKGVRPQFYYWEFVMMAKRYCVSMISAFMISDLTLATSLILLVIMFFAILNLALKPYNLMVFNVLQEYSFYSSYLVFFFCLYYVVDQEEKSQLICIIFIILGLIVFFARFIKYIVKAYKAELKVIVSRLDSFMSKKKITNRSLQPVQSNENMAISNNYVGKSTTISKHKSSGNIELSKKKETHVVNKLPLKTMKITPAPPQKKYANDKDKKKPKVQEINLKIRMGNDDN